jgi:hypothetical protein
MDTAIAAQLSPTYGDNRSPMLRAGAACVSGRAVREQRAGGGEGDTAKVGAHRAIFHSRPTNPVRCVNICERVCTCWVSVARCVCRLHCAPFAVPVGTAFWHTCSCRWPAAAPSGSCGNQTERSWLRGTSPWGQPTRAGRRAGDWTVFGALFYLRSFLPPRNARAFPARMHDAWTGGEAERVDDGGCRECSAAQARGRRPQLWR